MKSLYATRIFTPALLASAVSMAAGAADFSNVSTVDAAQLAPSAGQSATLGEISPAQLARAQAKLAHAAQIADRFAQSAAEAGLPDRWRFEMVNALMQKPEAAFAQVETAGNVRDALQSAAAVPQASMPTQAKSLGDIGDDLTYVPLTAPCRISDTRSGGGALAPFTARTLNFTISNAAQGGSGCNPFGGYVGGGLPGAAAVNITVIGGGAAAAGSYLQAYPQGGSTTTSWLNYGAGQIIANQGVLPLNTSNGQFVLYSNAQTDAIVDVFGSFVRPQATALDCVSTAPSAGVTLNTTTRDGNATAPACAAGYTSVAIFSNASGDYPSLANIVTNDFAVFYHYYGSTSATFTAAARCCRTPGR